ncbi:MAG: von Willebrand factor type A domain-containing protein [Archangiaceae bacterium]|nr:von Willebrand factor type A domain-containing protein [Archangiaceae bacterium]
MKRVLLAAVMVLQSCALMSPGAERAAQAPSNGPARSKHTTELGFDDETIEGDLKKPDGEYVEARNKAKHSEPIREREKQVQVSKNEASKPVEITSPTVPDPAPQPKGGADSSGQPRAGEKRAEGGRREEAADPSTLLQHYGVNPTVDTAAERVSTFAADVDTGSYTLARGYLEREQLPPEAAVRVEEFVNAFDYGYRAPEKEAFAVSVEAFPSPYRKGYHVLHVGVKGREVKAAERKRAGLTFVIDVSGSMDAANRLPMAVKAMTLLTEQLREDDSVAVVVYGSSAHVVLPPTSASQKSAIIGALQSLHSEGSTNVQAGLELAYETALKQFKAGGTNRVILCSDGVANNGITQADGIFARVKGKASEGITLTTVGFGMGSYNDVLMERLADQGDGQYAYVDRIEEARRIFVEQLTGTLEVIAKDVKLQLEFNPEAVERYRLLGFENRSLRKEDFANDKVDAGELGAGHAVTAIYEMKLKSRAPKFFATFRARFKQPQGGQSALVEKALPTEVVRDGLAQSSGPTRMSLVAAGFAEKLRGSYWARNLSWDELLSTWESLPEALKSRQQTQELRTLILTAKRLDKRPDRWEREMPLAQMDFDRIPVLK